MSTRTAHTTPRTNVPGFRARGAYHGFEEFELTKNGLRVLVREDTTAPVVGIMVTYLVGSRHEAVGHTGATHLLEHLMFKGSTKFPPKGGVGALDRLGETGALVNASTWLDRTNYYEVLPEAHAEYAIELEADRMRNAILTEKDRAEEMPAVRSEYAMRVENSPEEYLDERIWATAFMAHPYHHPTIGWQDDFEKVSIERLKEFYDTYYWPNNAVVTIVGDLSVKRALTLIKRHFGVHPRSPHPIPEPYTREAAQHGERRVVVERSGTKNLVAAAYRVPEALHADTPTLLVLAEILAGGTSSRLHRALIETRLASDVDCTYVPFFDPSLMPFFITPCNGVTHEKVERALNKTIATLQDESVHSEELARARAHVATEIAFARDGHYATLSALNEAIAAGDWRFFFDLPKAVSKVTAAQVRNAARTYLTASARTVGHYIART